MAKRNFSLIEYFNRRAEELKPGLTFKGRTAEEWRNWRKSFRKKMGELLGEFPKPVALNPDTVYSVDEGDFTRERVVIDTEEHFSVPMYVLVPKDRKRSRGGKFPAILCLHGHGQFGKEPVAGVNDPNLPELARERECFNYDYGAQMARRGFLTACPDSRAFGELADGGNPYPGRDKCNVHFIRGALMGINLLTLNVWDMMKTVDYLGKREDVDAERIGAMGLSWGGTRTTWIAAMDERIKAADIICYVTQFQEFAVRHANFCGSQFVPGLYACGDVADIAGLIAPRPLLVESATHDTCFPVEPVLRAHQHLKRIYHAAGSADKLHIDLFPGGHQFHGPSAFKFFETYL